MPATVVPALVSAEAASALPMPPLAYALIAFASFLAGLAVLWSFRNTAAKIADKEARVRAARAGRSGQPPSGDQH
ncbi:MAG: hypothetical protein M3Y71_14120 [Actinomycetota bacterium]|nr:hypothetical protein [Actinomycetota bacterium]